MNQNKALVAFEGKNIRRIWHKDEWWFSIVDIIAILTESSAPRRYWSDLKVKLNEEGFELYDKIVQLKLLSADGKQYETDCATTELLFRIIQSIPSRKAELFKRWLAQVGYERVQEIENPELAQARMKELYRQKGYPEEWIEKRVRGIAVRQELTDEWKNKGVTEEKDFAILTNEITKATFGKTVQEYKEFKSIPLKNQNLRDHMNDIELILTMLGEATTTRFTRDRNSQKWGELQRDAPDGGNVAGATKKDIEKKLGKSIVSNDNFLEGQKSKKQLL